MPLCKLCIRWSVWHKMASSSFNMYSEQPVLSGQAVLMGHLAIPRGWPHNTGLTVLLLNGTNPPCVSYLINNLLLPLMFLSELHQFIPQCNIFPLRENMVADVYDKQVKQKSIHMILTPTNHYWVKRWYLSLLKCIFSVLPFNLIKFHGHFILFSLHILDVIQHFGYIFSLIFLFFWCSLWHGNVKCDNKPYRGYTRKSWKRKIYGCGGGSSRGKMGTKICLFLDWGNEVWVNGTKQKSQKWEWETCLLL